MWAVAARGPYDPSCNSTRAGSCALLIGEPRPALLNRTACETDLDSAWVPSVKTPRYVDVRFQLAAPSLRAARVEGVALLLLGLGSMESPITSIELILATSGRALPVLVYAAAPAAGAGAGGAPPLACPGLVTLPVSIPTELRDAVVAGLRINVTDAELGGAGSGAAAVRAVGGGGGDAVFGAVADGGDAWTAAATRATGGGGLDASDAVASAASAASAGGGDAAVRAAGGASLADRRRALPAVAAAGLALRPGSATSKYTPAGKTG